jgi:hypothetical protein
MRRLQVFLAAAAGFSRTDALRTTNDIRNAPFLGDHRRVEGYAYLDDVSGYNMIFSKCIRVKIQNNGDDDGEGNSYFANGRYHAQYQNYASFYLCDGGSSCGTCDYSTEYVTDLITYLEASTGYIQGMCNACSANCRRRLEEEEEEEGDEDNEGGGYDYSSIDCSTCSKTCKNLSSNNGGADETNYLECQEAVENNGIQYYSAPQCGSEMNIIIGLYYDDDCTVKTSMELDYGFSYNTFHLMEDSCFDCSSGLCEDLYDESLHCVNGYNKNNNADDDDMPVCKVAKSMADRTYSKRKKQLKFMPLVILVVMLTLFFLFGSYTYYVRHKNPLAEPLSGQAAPTDLPPIS